MFTYFGSVNEYILYFISTMSLENMSVSANGKTPVSKVMKWINKSIAVKNANYLFLVVTKIKVSNN